MDTSEKMVGTVFYISCDTHVTCHVIMHSSVMQLKALNSRIQEVCQSCDHQPPERVVGQSCCARYQQESWCRVTVRGVESGGGSVDVRTLVH